MTLPSGLIAAMGATVVIGSAAAWFAVNSSNETPTAAMGAASSADPVSAWAAESDDVVVCVGEEDNVLRVPPNFASECPGGQEELELEDDDEELCELCDPFDDKPSDPKADDPAIAALEERIRKLENTPYFEVVSQKGERVIFSIGPSGARFFNDSGAPVAAVGTGAAGGYFSGRSTGEELEAAIGASGSRVGVVLFQGGFERAGLASREGAYAVRFPSTGKGLIAGIGQSPSGTGAIAIGKVTGVSQGAVTVTDARAMLSLVTDAGPGGVGFTEATIGGGLMDLATARGDAAVRMGHNGHRYGIVLAGPVLGLPYVPRSGLPGSYFMGCASGQKPACIPEVAGQ